MGKTYKTAMGKSIDMGAMVLANEKIRAVGNMKVNARGDIIDSNNNVLKTRQQQLAEQYGSQNKKQNRPSSAQKPRPEKSPAVDKNLTQEETKSEIVESLATLDFPDDVLQDDVEVIKESDQAPSGLAAAISKSRENKKQ